MATKTTATKAAAKPAAKSNSKAKTNPKVKANAKSARRAATRRFNAVVPCPLITAPANGASIFVGTQVNITVQTNSPTLTHTLTIVDPSGNVANSFDLDNTLWTGTPPTQVIQITIPGDAVTGTYMIWLEVITSAGVFAQGIELDVVV